MSSRRCYYARQGRNNNVNFSVILFTNRKQTDEQTSLSKHYLHKPVAEIMMTVAVERDRQCRLRSWTRSVKTGIKNYARVHGRLGHQYVAGVQHGPWTRVVCTERYLFLAAPDLYDCVGPRCKCWARTSDLTSFPSYFPLFGDGLLWCPAEYRGKHDVRNFVWALFGWTVWTVINTAVVSRSLECDYTEHACALRPLTEKLLVNLDPGLYFFINQGCLTVDHMDDKEEMQIVEVYPAFCLVFFLQQM